MINYKGYTDVQLSGLLLGGDRFAYTEIYNRYKRPLYLFAFKRLGHKEEAWDIVHEVFLSLWKSYEKLEIIYTLSTYLHAAVRNRIANLISHKKISERYLDSFRDYLELENTTADHIIRHKELEILIQKSIADLPVQMRKVFELSRNTNYSRRQIGAELGLSEETVKSHMHQALKKLKLKLGSLLSIIFLF